MKLICLSVLLVSVYSLSCIEFRDLYPEIQIDCDVTTSTNADLLTALFAIQTPKIKLKTIEEEIQEKQSLKEQLLEENQKLQDEVDANRLKLESLKVNQSAALTEINELQGNKHELQGLILKMNGEIDNQFNQISKNNKLLDDIRNQIDQSSNENNSLGVQRLQIFEKYNEIARMTDDILKQKASLEESMQSLSLSVSAQQSEINVLKQQKSRLEEEVFKLAENEKMLLQSIEILRQKIEGAEDHLKLLEDSIEREKLEKERLEQLIETAMDKIKALEQQEDEEILDFTVKKQDRENTLDSINLTISESRQTAKEEMETQKRLEESERQKIQELMNSENKLIQQQKEALLQLQNRSSQLKREETKLNPSFLS